MSDEALIEDQARLTEERRKQADAAEQGARKAPAQSDSDFVEAPGKRAGGVRQTVPVPSRRK